jgi:hypothetical protein
MLSAFDAVATETAASLATSRSVGIAVSNRFIPGIARKMAERPLHRKRAASQGSCPSSPDMPA